VLLGAVFGGGRRQVRQKGAQGGEEAKGGRPPAPPRGLHGEPGRECGKGREGRRRKSEARRLLRCFVALVDHLPDPLLDEGHYGLEQPLFGLTALATAPAAASVRGRRHPQRLRHHLRVVEQAAVPVRRETQTKKKKKKKKMMKKG
jgi:hypothetical protein